MQATQARGPQDQSLGIPALNKTKQTKFNGDIWKNKQGFLQDLSPTYLLTYLSINIYI